MKEALERFINESIIPLALLVIFLLIAGTTYLHCVVQPAIYGLGDTGLEIVKNVYEITETAKEERIEEVNTLIANGFVVYLDGEEVNVEKIDISLYKTSIDYDNKIIYATRK